MSALLAPLSAVYSAAVAVRAALYRHQWLAAHPAGLPVVSIGNLVAGGTGKTPTAAHVARILLEAGASPVIVSRGYGGRRREDPLVVCEGNGMLPRVTSAQAGDEPAMLAAMLPNVPSVVARRRLEGARLAASRLGARCIILDDGFQHLALRRDLDIVLLDSTRPFDNGRLLPAGMLRESPGALSRAGAVLLAGPAEPGAPDAITRFLRPGVPVFRVTFVPTHLFDADMAAAHPPAWLAGKRIIAFAGIANPSRFAADLNRLGTKTIESRHFPDHHVYTPREVAEIIRTAKREQVDAIVTTEKDLARLASGPLLRALKSAALLALRIEVRIEPSDEAAFRSLVLAAANVARSDAGEPARPLPVAGPVPR